MKRELIRGGVLLQRSNKFHDLTFLYCKSDVERHGLRPSVEEKALAAIGQLMRYSRTQILSDLVANFRKTNMYASSGRNISRGQFQVP